MNLLILAGGAGTRLWPASRQNSPKQLLHLLDDKTLLQNTYQRSLKWVGKKQIYLATTDQYAKNVQRQLPGLLSTHMSVEPVLRDRGPAIGLAALLMHHNNPRASFMCLWSDHEISSRPTYFPNLLKKCEKYLQKFPQSTITIGVKPQFPHTGLGYIEKGVKVTNPWGLKLFRAKSFTEKPGLLQAKKYVDSNRYLWNSGYFMWRVDNLLGLYRQHLPKVYNLLMKIQPSLGTKKQAAEIKRWYSKMPEVDIEHGLLEKLSGNVLTIQGDFSWADIGSWKVVKQIQAPGKSNATRGRVLLHDTNNTLIYNYSSGLVATIGIDNLAIVVTRDEILVANQDSSEDVKKIIKLLKSKPHLKKYL